MKKLLAWPLAAAMMVTGTVACLAQSFPSRPMTIVVPFVAGGPTDSAGRIMARALEKQAGQPVVVENVGGAGSTIGAARVAAAPADGYTLLLATSSALVIAPHLYANLKYDSLKSFAPIGMITEAPFILMVNSASPYKTLADFIGYAKANPTKLNYGTPGLGTVQHLTFELIQDDGKLAVTHIPFKGAAPSVTALLGGEIDAIVETVNGSAAMIKAGRLRPLAITGTKRLAALPDIPTFEETGMKSVVSRSWFSLIAPQGMPPEVLDKLQSMLAKALADEETVTALRAAGFEPTPKSGAELMQMIREEHERFGILIKAKKIRLDG